MNSKELKKLQDETLRLSKKLIRFKSTHSRPAQLHKAAQFCADYYKDSGLRVKHYMHKSKPSVLVMSENTMKPDILLCGHIDVVEAELRDFTPRVKGGRLYGRGAGDMKSYTATLMVLMKHFGGRLRDGRSLGLFIAGDEEQGGLASAGYLVPDKGLDAKECVVLPDGGRGFKIVTEQKGVYWFDYVAHGNGAHSARPWDGHNAVEKFFDAYEEMKEKLPEPQDKHDWRPSIVLTKIRSGEEGNRVPHRCDATFDFRFPAGKSIAVWRKFFKAFAKKKGFDFNEQVYMEPFKLYKKGGKHVKSYKAIADKVLGKDVPFVTEAGASDARYFSHNGTTVLIMSARHGNIHSHDEWIEIASLRKFVEINARFLEEQLT